MSHSGQLRFLGMEDSVGSNPIIGLVTKQEGEVNYALQTM